MATKKGNPFGLVQMLVQRVGADGASYGTLGSGMANGTGSPAYVIEHPESFEVSLPDRPVIDFTGGDRWIGSHQFGVTSLGSFPASVAAVEAELIALVTGTAVDITSNQQWVEFSEDILADELPDVSVVATYRVQSRELATWGQTFYSNLIVPRCKMAPKGISGAPNFQSKGMYQFQITPNSNARRIDGRTFGASLRLTGNRAALYTVVTDNPIMMESHRANGASLNVTLARLPVSSAVGTATNTKMLLIKNAGGVFSTGVADTIDDETGDVEIGTALTVAAGNIVNILYETSRSEAAA